MSDNTHPQKSQRPQPNRNTRLENVTWQTTSPCERALLERVEGHIFSDEWIDSQQTSSAKKSTHTPSKMWQWGVPALAACTLIAVFVLPSSFPTKVAKPISRETKNKSLFAKPQRRNFLVPLGKSTKIARKNRWTAKLQGGTKLQLKTLSPRRIAMTLHKGRIRVHVIPGSMKSVVIRWKGAPYLVVKGTKFTVEQYKNWLRLEVTKGTVALSQKGRADRLIHAGNGIRIAIDQIHQTYRLPPFSHKQAERSLAWFAKHNAKQLCLAALDWSRRPQLTTKRKRRFLKKYAYQFQGMDQFGCSMRLFLRLYDLRSSKQDGEMNLISAAQSCRSSATQKGQCARLYRQYLRSYPNGFHVSRVRPWLRQTAIRPRK